MEMVTALEKVTTKLRPIAQTCSPPEPEIQSSHVAACPYCGAEVRVKVGSEAHLFAGCRHCIGVEEIGGVVSVLFEAVTQ